MQGGHDVRWVLAGGGLGARFAVPSGASPSSAPTGLLLRDAGSIALASFAGAIRWRYMLPAAALRAVGPFAAVSERGTPYAQWIFDLARGDAVARVADAEWTFAAVPARGAEPAIVVVGRREPAALLAVEVP
jgi:hypothetical protein